MATLHTYVITSMTNLGDVCTVTGTVDGIAVTVTVWWSAITKLPSTQAVINFLAPLMLAQIQAPAVTAVMTYNGTYTQ